MLPNGGRRRTGHGADGEDAKVELRPGDVVVFCSAGLPEAPASTVTPSVVAALGAPAEVGELFGFERLAQAAAYWSAHAENAEAVAAGLWGGLVA